MGLEAVGAVNGAIQPRLKGNLSLLAAVCTDYGEHLALSTEATRTGPLLPCRSALRAAAGLIGKASASVKILLSRGEDKAGSTITTRESLVCVHAITPLFAELEQVGARRSGGEARTYRPGIRPNQGQATDLSYHSWLVYQKESSNRLEQELSSKFHGLFIFGALLKSIVSCCHS